MTNVTWRDLGAAYTAIAAEIKQRQEAASDDQAPIYILIYDIQRFRDLRKSDDDFGYSRYDEDKPMPPRSSSPTCFATARPSGSTRSSGATASTT